MKDNEEYLDMIKDYFEKTGEMFYAGKEVKDIKAEYLYQTGVMPELTEIARDHQKLRNDLNLAPEDQPLSPMVSVLDAKWRFMWKIGVRPDGAADDFPQVIPDNFPNWDKKMNAWGNKLNQASFTVAEMAAIGMGIN